MLTKLCFLALVAFVASETLKDVVPIVEQSMNIEPEGRFQWSYESGDGSKASQAGDVKAVENEMVVGHQGSYSYTGDDGKVYTVTYTADETGYHPVGEHIPGIPLAIQKALDYLKTLPPSKE